MPTISNDPKPAYAYDTETDTWYPLGTGAHTHGDIPLSIVDAKGDLISASAADSPQRIGVGANGTILTANSATATGLEWAAPAGGGGMTLLSTTALSGASVSVTSISGAYTDLLIIISRLSTTSDSIITGTFNSNSGTIYQLNNTVATSIPFSRGIIADQIASASNNWVLTASQYASATIYKPLSLTAGFVNASTGAQATYADGGSFISNTAITSFQIVSGTGTFDGGNIYIYGVK